MSRSRTRPGTFRRCLYWYNAGSGVGRLCFSLRIITTRLLFPVHDHTTNTRRRLLSAPSTAAEMLKAAGRGYCHGDPMLGGGGVLCQTRGADADLWSGVSCYALAYHRIGCRPLESPFDSPVIYEQPQHCKFICHKLQF